MDGLKSLLLILAFIMAPFQGGSVELDCDCGAEVQANGRSFQSMQTFHFFNGELYPIYVDSQGVRAYSEGLLILEIRSVENYDSALAWSVKADELTTYSDLRITLLNFNDPQEAERAYWSIWDSEDPNVIYMELGLIEEPIWENSIVRKATLSRE